MCVFPFSLLQFLSFLSFFFLQSQYTYTVVESLIIHLDKNSKTAIKIRTSIAEVLAKIIAIAASDSVGKFFFIRNLYVKLDHRL